MNLVIYGAQSIALGVYNAIKELHPDKSILCFLVTSMDNNASVLGGIPVLELDEFVRGKTQEDKNDIEVLIGTPESVMNVIEKKLDEVGLYNHIRIDSIRWADMQKLAFAKNGLFMPLEAYPIGCHKPKLSVYKMVHYKDKTLQNNFLYPEYFMSVQVGVSLTDERVAKILDNSGDNISEKNGNYSELTGLYWIWKNVEKYDKEPDKNYIGLAHYRRLLDLSGDDQSRLLDNDIDVVLPYPMPYEPNIEMHHKRYLSDAEWSSVLQALDELQPEYAKAFKDILKQKYFYNYNIIIAKGKVLSDYCEWLFPILFRLEKINDPDRTKKPNRFIGYIGETLETLYFMHNKERLKIAHSGCKFLV